MRDVRDEIAAMLAGDVGFNRPNLRSGVAAGCRLLDGVALEGERCPSIGFSGDFGPVCETCGESATLLGASRSAPDELELRLRCRCGEDVVTLPAGAAMVAFRRGVFGRTITRGIQGR